MTMEPLLNDVRLAWRGLRRAKGFTLAAVLTLAVGMAGVTTMFALIQGVLLRPLPMPDADRLVVVSKEIAATGAKHWPFQRAEVNLIREQTAIFERVAAISVAMSSSESCAAPLFAAEARRFATAFVPCTRSSSFSRSMATFAGLPNFSL